MGGGGDLGEVVGGDSFGGDEVATDANADSPSVEITAQVLGTDTARGYDF